MRPRLATVLSGREWEPDLVEASRRTGRLRVVGRAYQPEELENFGPIDCIAVGSETAWLDSEFIQRWKRRGTRVVGVHPAGDNPGARLFSKAHADLVTPDTAEPIDLVHRISLLSLDPRPVSVLSRVTAVTGTQGAPGRTSVAVGLSLALGKSFLIDAEVCPGVGPRFSLPPDADRLIIGEQAISFAHPYSSTSSVGGAQLRTAISNARSSYANVVIDCGILDSSSNILRSADVVLLVVDASTTGLIRASRALERWTLNEPIIVLNKVEYPSDVQSCRYATGIEPSVIIPRLDSTDQRLITEAIQTHAQFLVQGLSASG